MDGKNWEIIDSYLHTPNRYQLKINSVLIENSKTKVRQKARESVPAIAIILIAVLYIYI